MTTRKDIVIDESEQIEKLLQYGFENNIATGFQLTLLAKHYISEGCKKTECKKNIIDFCRKHVPEFNEIVYRSEILNAIKNASKYKIRKTDGFIYITKSEIEKINSLEYPYSKVLFVMLAVAKYNRKYSSKMDAEVSDESPYVCRKSIGKIMSLCGVKGGEKNEIDMKLMLRQEREFISLYTKKIKDCWIINIVDEESENEILINDIKKVTTFFPYYCKTCGKQIEKKGNRQLYCEDCWKEKERKRAKNNAY